jgi:hypothetical protein
MNDEVFGSQIVLRRKALGTLWVFRLADGLEVLRRKGSGVLKPSEGSGWSRLEVSGVLKALKRVRGVETLRRIDGVGLSGRRLGSAQPV